MANLGRRIRVQGLKSRGGDEFSKNFLTPGGGGPRVGMIFNPRRERVVTPIFY